MEDVASQRGINLADLTKNLQQCPMQKPLHRTFESYTSRPLLASRIQALVQANLSW